MTGKNKTTVNTLEPRLTTTTVAIGIQTYAPEQEIHRATGGLQ